MKAILMSIKPQHVANILNEIKTLEIRKKFPSDYVGWVYIYCTKGKPLFVCKDHRGIVVKLHDTKKNVLEQLCANGKVVGRFWCDKVEDIIHLNDDFSCDCVEVGYKTEEHSESELLEKSCLETLDDYLGGNNGIVGYAIHITNLEIFDKPKEISEFKQYKKFSEIDYMLPIPRKETCERLVALTRAPQSWCYVEV